MARADTEGALARVASVGINSQHYCKVARERRRCYVCERPFGSEDELQGFLRRQARAPASRACPLSAGCMQGLLGSVCAKGYRAGSVLLQLACRDCLNVTLLEDSGGRGCSGTGDWGDGECRQKQNRGDESMSEGGGGLWGWRRTRS
jgi:hypothetical protein